MKKIGKLGLTLAMVLAMAIGTTATAFATDAGESTQPSSPTTSITADENEAAFLTKNVTVNAAGLLENTTFQFKLKYDKAEAIGTNTPIAPTGGFDENSSDTKTVSLTVNKPTDDTAGTATTASATMKLSDLFSGISFSAPGTYSFKLTEVTNGENKNPNLVYDTSEYTIKVQIVWATNEETGAPTNELEFTGVGVEKDGKKVEDKTVTFNNTANNNTGTLTVTKQVAGNAANTNDEFEFTVKLNGSVSGSYPAKIDGTATTNAGTDQDGTKYTLKHGQKLEITNLPADATWEVTESNSKGYTVTTTYTADKDSEGNVITGEATLEDGNGAKGVIQEKGADETADTDDVTFTNTKSEDPPTGVFMDILPYVLIAVVAAAACFFFAARRRREDY